MPKFCASTCFCARAMERVTILCSMGTPSSMPILSSRPLMRSEPKMRIRSSSQRKVEARRARVALAAGAAAELVVDAARFVPFGGEDVQPAERHDALALALVEERDDPLDLA